MSQSARRLDGRDKGRPLSDYGEKRRCAEPGCETILSRYTKGEHCWQHQSRDLRAGLSRW